MTGEAGEQATEELPLASPEAEPVSEWPEDKVALGNLAKMLTGNPAIPAAFDKVVRTIASQWERTDPLATALRESLYHDMRALRLLQAGLGEIAQAGKVEGIRRDKLRVA